MMPDAEHSGRLRDHPPTPCEGDKFSYPTSREVTTDEEALRKVATEEVRVGINICKGRGKGGN